MPAFAEIFKAIIQGLGVFFNYQASENANQTNIRLAQEANASSKEQADLAYQRSLPINQVRALMDAGYSKIGALQTLNGGGSYSAAPIQSATVEPNKLDLAGLNSAMDALTSIPSSIQQYQINNLHKKDLAAQTEIRLNEDRRAQEIHEFNMWRQSYDKDTALMLDNASSKVANSLIDSGKTIEDFKDFESMIRGLDLDKDKNIRNITHIARQQLEDGVRSKFDTERARQAQQNANRAAEDTHTLQTQQLMQLREDYKNSVKEHKTQDVERLVREGRAQLEQILLDRDISIEDFRKSIRFDNDGKPNILNRSEEHIKEAWRFLGDLFGLGYLGDILRGLFAVAPKG